MARTCTFVLSKGKAELNSEGIQLSSVEENVEIMRNQIFDKGDIGLSKC